MLVYNKHLLSNLHGMNIKIISVVYCKLLFLRMDTGTQNI